MSPVALEEQTQAFECEVHIDSVDGFGAGLDGGRKTARGDDASALAQLPAQSPDQSINHSAVSKQEARLQALRRVAADRELRRRQRHTRELRGVDHQGLFRNFETRRDSSTEICAVAGNSIERG